MALTSKRPTLRPVPEQHTPRTPLMSPPAAAALAGSEERLEQDQDKAYAELLQEVRVARTGVQILLGFLMTFAFSPRFSALTEFQAGQYVLTLLVAFGAGVFLTAPVPFHRVVFRCDMRTELWSGCGSACRCGAACGTGSAVRSRWAPSAVWTAPGFPGCWGSTTGGIRASP
ncbi:DUF6328 family protein [Streptomyces sp. NPDC001903]|uniref:DUF6328 family protein n=1 Tax=Streptomyces sp. NPDC001903 TaxID=3364622 RepID=UPI00369E882F